MKEPPEAIERLLNDAKVRREQAAIAEAREAAAALARESAATAFAERATRLGVEVPRSARAFSRDLDADAPRIVDRVFDHLGRPSISAPWEELASSSKRVGLPELAHALDRLSKTRGTSDEAAWRISAALAASSARGSRASWKEGGNAGAVEVAGSLAEARTALLHQPRVAARIQVTQLLLDGAHWIIFDHEGSAMYLVSSPALATIAATLATDDTAAASGATGSATEIEAIVARDESVGAIAVLAVAGTSAVSGREGER